MHTILGTMTFGGQVDKDGTRRLIEQYRDRGHVVLDTAYVYNDGATERLLGELGAEGVLDGMPIAGKANPREPGGLTPASVDRQLEASLERLRVDALDLFYLHAPDLDTPIGDTLAAVARHHEAGRFHRFGLSNYAAWQVAEIVGLCEAHGWPRPVVYQGMYNALTRDVERELLPCLSNLDIAFYAYNPLAGGLLTAKYESPDALPDTGRFAGNASYLDRYWKGAYFDVIARVADVARRHDIDPAAAALRWLRHHSALAASESGETDHAVILGATSAAHLRANLDAWEAGPLPEALVDAYDTGWETVRPVCIKYFRP